jgi:hypothetical protein
VNISNIAVWCNVSNLVVWLTRGIDDTAGVSFGQEAVAVHKVQPRQAFTPVDDVQPPIHQKHKIQVAATHPKFKVRTYANKSASAHLFFIFPSRQQ